VKEIFEQLQAVGAVRFEMSLKSERDTVQAPGYVLKGRPCPSNSVLSGNAKLSATQTASRSTGSAEFEERELQWAGSADERQRCLYECGLYVS
jgi:hypothetical protein